MIETAPVFQNHRGLPWGLSFHGIHDHLWSLPHPWVHQVLFHPKNTFYKLKSSLQLYCINSNSVILNSNPFPTYLPLLYFQSLTIGYFQLSFFELSTISNWICSPWPKIDPKNSIHLVKLEDSHHHDIEPCQNTAVTLKFGLFITC